MYFHLKPLLFYLQITGEELCSMYEDFIAKYPGRPVTLLSLIFLENKLKKKNQCLMKTLQRNGFKTTLHLLWEFYFSHVVQHHTN